MVSNEVRRGQSLEGRDVPRTRHNDVRLAALIAARPIPHADPSRAMCDGVVHGKVVERRLLAGHDHVDIVAAAKAVIHDREQGVGVRRQIHANDLSLLVDHVVDEAGVLVGKAVVILAPDV